MKTSARSLRGRTGRDPLPASQRSLPRRRGAILLIVLGLLSLFMLITISFVLETGHERRGARAAAKAEQQGDPPDALLKMAMYQVIRGPRSPNSVIGPHSLLEDVYGEYEGVVGAIAQVGPSNVQLLPRYVANDNFIEITGVFFGPDRKPGQAGVDDQGQGVQRNQIVDDVAECPLTSGTTPPLYDDYRFGFQPTTPLLTNQGPFVDNVEGFYAGRVITMLSGNCNKLSTRIVRYFQTDYNPQTGAGTWVMWLKPFDTLPVAEALTYTPLTVGDIFVVNGRPYNGAGFGYHPIAAALPQNNQADLGLSWAKLFQNNSLTDIDSIAPFALTPNPTHPRYQDYLNDRTFVNPQTGQATLSPALQAAMQNNPGSFPVPITVDADEDYDAPDFQNMMLAQRIWIPNAPTNSTQNMTNSGSWQVRIPSLHRPELVDYWMRTQGMNPLTIPWSALPAGQKQGANYLPRLRQRIMLRPDPIDHVFTDLNNNGTWDFGEPNWSSNTQFNAISGPWDVDNDNDGAADSIWVDLGAPVQTAPDGTQFKPLFAILCLDMDGRLNINAHGNSSQYEFATVSSLKPPYDKPQYSVPQIPSQNYNAETDEANIVGMTAYHGYALNLLNGGTAAVPIPVNGPYAANLPLSASNSTSYYGQQPNATSTNFPANPPGSGSNIVSYAKSVGTGLGFSVAEINLAPVVGFHPGLETGNPGNGNTNGVVRTNHVRWLMEGRYENFMHPAKSTFQRAPIPGRYGETHLTVPPNLIYATNPPMPRPQAGITALQPAGGQGGNSSSQGQPNSSGDDNGPGAVVYQSVPAALGPLLSPQGNANFGQPVGNAALASGVNGGPNQNANLAHVYGGYNPSPPLAVGNNGSPIDPMGKLMPGLDLRGQPLYANQGSSLVTALGVPADLLDDPWELDLSDKASRTGLLYGQGGRIVGKYEIDKPFTPADLETILRYADIDGWALQQRAEYLLEMNVNSPQTSGDTRNRVTTESWDIPCPNIIAPPEMLSVLNRYGLPTTNLMFSDLVRGKILTASFMTTGSTNSITVQQATAAAQTLMGCNQNMIQTNGTYVTDRLPWRAISPDLLLGLRMDINRPFGNGLDDNGNGVVDEPLETLHYWFGSNGSLLIPSIYTSMVAAVRGTNVAIPPALNPVLWPEPLWKNNNIANMRLGVGMDTNWDGYVAFTDALARQEYAKHLYTLMMLVTDIQYTQFYPMLDSLPSTGIYPAPVGPAAVAYGGSLSAYPTPREILHAYRVAQWAVNVVDFRDRDSIMTWFEFDIRPFYKDVTQATIGAFQFLSSASPPITPLLQQQIYATWEVDGRLTTANPAFNPTTGTPPAFQTPYISYDDWQPYRGLVWGMESPDLLITETVAFHDKAVADSATDNNPQGGSNTTVPTRMMGTRRVVDPDWDQIRVPQGSLFVELYCPAKPNTPGWPTVTNQPPPGPNGPTTGYNANYYPSPNLAYYPPELYDVVNPITFPPMTAGVNNPQGLVSPPGSPNPGLPCRYGALNLSKTDPNGVYPVWRLATTSPRAQTGQRNDVQTVFQAHPDSSILQPYVASSPNPLTPTGTPPTTPTLQQLALTLDQSVWNNWLENANQSNGTMYLGRQTRTLDRVAYFTTKNAKFTGTTNGGVFTANGINDFYYQGLSSTSTPSWPGYAGLPTVAQLNSNPIPSALPVSARSLNPPYGIFLQPGNYAVVGPYRGSQSESPVTSAASTWNATFIGYVNSGAAPPAPNARTVGQVINLQSQALSTTTATMVSPSVNYATLKNSTTLSAATLTNTNFQYPSTVLGTGSTQAKIKFPLGIPLAACATTGAATANPPLAAPSTPGPNSYLIGLNISVPNGGYSHTGSGWTGTWTAPSQSSIYTVGGLATTVKDSWPSNSSPDTPWDGAAVAGGRSRNPYLSNVGANDDTTNDACSVLLQRLADPTMPYNQFTNPYLTVDWMNVDLTVFNGQTSWNVTGTQYQLVKGFDVGNGLTIQAPGGAPVAGTNSILPYNFQSRQRGPRIPQTSNIAVASAPAAAASLTTWTQTLNLVQGTYPAAYGWPASVDSRNSPLIFPTAVYGYSGFNEAPLWSSFTDDPNPTMAVGQGKTGTAPNQAPNQLSMTSLPAFNHYLYSTLGYLNEGYGVVSSASYSPGAIDGGFIGTYQGHYSQVTPTQSAPFNVLYDYIGDPVRPFPWLTWNNRPFANPMELMLVPASSPERFGWEFTYKTHYTDPIVSPLLGANYPQYRLMDNHYAPFRNPYWDYISATALWNKNANQLTTPPATANSLAAMVPLLSTAPAATGTPPPRPNIASSQTVFPPPQMDYTVDYSNSGYMYRNLTNGFDPQNPAFWPFAQRQLYGGYPFGHLLNFFSSTAPLGNPYVSNQNLWGSNPWMDPVVYQAVTPPVNTPNGWQGPASPNYFRLLELVTVPSPFSGTEDIMFPINTLGQPITGNSIQASFLNGGLPAINNATTVWPPNALVRWPISNSYTTNNDSRNYYPFHAPFNRISRFREPGRVNLNTITDRDIGLTVSATQNPSSITPVPLSYSAPMWRAITNDFPNYNQTWFDLKASMSVIDPRGPNRIFNAIGNRLDDLWPAPANLRNHFNLYGIGEAPSANNVTSRSLTYASQIMQSLGQQGPASLLGPLNGSAMPTLYCNPFRSYLNPMRVPLTGMWNRYKISAATGSQAMAPMYFVDATLLRRADPDVMYGSEPVFCSNGYAWNQGVNPAGASSALMSNQRNSTTDSLMSSVPYVNPYPLEKVQNEITSSFNDPNRNPFFRYYPLQKIGAAATTHSNVYAVWVTVGYFEVQKIPLSGSSSTKTDPRYGNPDGYQLVRELYSDTGGAKRNRAFFIFDRSIPVGFLRGESLNVDKAIRLQRIIQ